MGSSAQNSSGVHWCRGRVRFNEVPDKVRKVPEKVWEALVQREVRFNRVPEIDSGEGRGGFGGEPGQVQQGSGEAQQVTRSDLYSGRGHFTCAALSKVSKHTCFQRSYWSGLGPVFASSVYKNARLGLALPDTGRRHESLQKKDVEPAWKALHALRQSKTMEVHENPFLRASFDGLGTHWQIGNWITKTLDKICRRTPTTIRTSIRTTA